MERNHRWSRYLGWFQIHLQIEGGAANGINGKDSK